MFYVISYQDIAAKVVDSDEFEEISSRYLDTVVLESGGERKCNKYCEKLLEEMNSEEEQKIDLSDYDTAD